MRDVIVAVDNGVVLLTGSTNAADAARRAESIARRIAGVVTVENAIERAVTVESRVAPALSATQSQLRSIIQFLLLLLALAFGVAAIVAFLGILLAGLGGLWSRLTPNIFVAELARSTIRLLFIAFGVVAALNLLDATWLLSAFWGAAGVIGLAVGFAIRDTIENYVASLILSVRQPFRPNDHVVIGDREGRVVRLTSRATILMTLDGNHLRIPNAAVFKAIILNYSTNPERRIDFRLGIGADDDALMALKAGISAIAELEVALRAPLPLSFIEKVGDPNIVLFFGVWIDQRMADFEKSRSAAIAAAKTALEKGGFSIPEPSYRLRFDPGAPLLIARRGEPPGRPAQAPAPVPASKFDTSPDRHIERKVEEERGHNDPRDDLLSGRTVLE